MGFLLLILYPGSSAASSASSHTIFVTTQSLSPTIFHTQSLSPTIFHTHLCQTPSFTNHLCHQSQSLSHNLCHNTSLSSHTIFVTQSLSNLCHTPSLTHNFTRVALGDIRLRFACQAWHLVTSTFVLRGTRGTYGTGLALVARLGWDWSPVTPRHFCGRRGTW